LDWKPWAGLSISIRSLNSSIDHLIPVNRLLPSWTHPGVFFVCLLLTVSPAAGDDPLREAQAAFKSQQYDRALQLLDSSGKATATPEFRRLRTRTLAKLNRGKEALAEYEALTQPGKKDEPALLREVAFACIVPLLKDMRVQMRGAGYTALNEIESEESVPYFEDGLSDGAGQVRALAAEGLGSSKPAGARRA